VTRDLIRRVPLRRWDGRELAAAWDEAAVEQALEIRVAASFKDRREEHPLVLILCSPGAEEELAAGFLAAEGIIAAPRDIAGFRRDSSGALVVELAAHVDFDPRAARPFQAATGCGACGRRSFAATAAGSAAAWRVPAPVLAGLTFGAEQAGFRRSGGLHAAALFSPPGELLALREDIGRHNALDKLLGAELLAGRWPAAERLVLLSSRASYDLVEKCAAAGVPVLAAIGAPSTLAIETADRAGITLAAFVREGRCNVYTHPWRVEQCPGAD
jgi:FdhD protein